jgi:3-oxoacyl-[acyl-carrier-protein] synthase-3
MSRVMETSDEWIQQRTGIVQRHFAPPGTATSDLAVIAAEAAITDAGVTKEDIDAVVFATMTPDHYFPGAGSEFHLKMGLRPVPCLDIRQQCAGFLYGLQVADAYIQCGRYRTVLLIGAEVHGGFMPWKAWDILLGGSDRQLSAEEYAWNSRFRDRAVLFGDGAGAAVLQAGPDDGPGLIDLQVRTDGRHWNKMWIPSGGSAYRPHFDAEMIERGDTVPIVEGQEVFRVAVTLMPESVQEILRRHNYTTDDLDLLVMHQANLRINEAARKKLDLPEEKVFNNIQKYGNTTAATIPMAFHEARLAGKVNPGDLICFVALGSGLNWGAALYRW